jgi:hypothetical protein
MPRKGGETAEEYYERAIRELIETGARYERALRAIGTCTLLGTDFGDYVQATCDDVLEGGEAECWKCGTPVHDGPCVGEGESDAG